MPLTGEDSNGFAALSSLPESRSRSSSIDLPLFERTTSPCSSSSARALEASLGVRPATSLSSAALSTSGCATRVTKAACALEDRRPPRRYLRGSLDVAAKAKKGRKACTPGTTKGTPCTTSAFLCLASRVSLTMTTGRSVYLPS